MKSFLERREELTSTKRDAASDGAAAMAVRRLQVTKFVRALWQGAMVVVFSLYLIESGWSSTSVGVLFTVGGILSAATGWIVGSVSDRLGRRWFLLSYEAATVVAGLVLAFFDQPSLLAAASLLFGFGRSQAGIPGSAAAAEQAWLAQAVTPTRRGVVFSQNAALGFFGMAAGSLPTGLVPTIQTWLPGILAYRPFFALAAVASLFNLVVLWPVEEREHGHDAVEDDQPESSGEKERAIRREENVVMAKMALINGLNGVAVGLTSPLLVYWFNMKFGVGPGALGPVFALTYFATGLSSVWTGRLTAKIGIVRAVVTVRLAAVLLLIAVPLMPTFTLAAIVHVLRSALGRGSVGARRALAVNLVRNRRRGLASSVNNMSMALPQAAGPSIAGVFLDAGQLTLPFYAAAAMQFLYGTFYGAAFQRYEQGPKPPGKKPLHQLKDTVINTNME